MTSAAMSAVVLLLGSFEIWMVQVLVRNERWLSRPFKGKQRIVKTDSPFVSRRVRFGAVILNDAVIFQR